MRPIDSVPWLLIATPQLLDQNFAQSIVLIVEHSTDGAMGFIVNRPTPVPLATLVQKAPVQIPDNIPAWSGGPVGSSIGIVLQDQTAVVDRGDERTPSLALSANEGALVDLVHYAERRQNELRTDGAQQCLTGLYPYRFLVGYAGWGPGQLDEELRGGAWIRARATWQLVFNTDWQTAWATAIGTVAGDMARLVPAVSEYLN